LVERNLAKVEVESSRTLFPLQIHPQRVSKKVSSLLAFFVFRVSLSKSKTRPHLQATIAPMKTIRLRAGKERSLLRRHPWIFESAIAKGGGDSGETVRVESAEGAFLGWAAFSPQSKIRARVWSFDEKQRIDASFFIAACAQAIRR